MRVGLNLLQAHPGIGGGWNYINNVISVLRYHVRENVYIVYCNNESADLISDCTDWTIRIPRLNHRNRISRILCEMTWLQIQSVKDRLDLVYWFGNTCPPVCSKPALVTVHDLLVYDRAHSFPLHNVLYLRTLLPLTMARAKTVVTVSNWTMQDVRDRFPNRNSNLAVVPNPLSLEFRKRNIDDIAQFRHKYDLSSHFWLYVAHYYPHKNHKRLIEAYGNANRISPGIWPLVLRGDFKGYEGKLHNHAARYGVKDKVAFLPQLSDAEMPVLYSSASALVFPSLFEGGGIPILEAMGCGCPVIASDIPTTREFGRDAVLRFDPNDTDSISTAMITMQADHDLRLRCVELGRKTAAEFTMPQVAKAIRHAIQITACLGAFYLGIGIC